MSLLTQTELKRLFQYLRNGTFRRKVRVGKSDSKGQIVSGTFRRSDGYKHLQVNKKLYLFHRIVYFYHHGILPKYIDHIDRNRLNNRIENLREVTAAQNSRNCGLYKTNTSGYKGVQRATNADCWIARISFRINGQKKSIHLYCGKSKEKAIEARKAAEKRYYG